MYREETAGGGEGAGLGVASLSLLPFFHSTGGSGGTGFGGTGGGGTGGGGTGIGGTGGGHWSSSRRPKASHKEVSNNTHTHTHTNTHTHTRTHTHAHTHPI